jgi:hypothetical protein
MVSIKNNLFYILTAGALGWVVYQGRMILGHKRTLEETHPECMASNPNFFTLFSFTFVFLCAINLICQTLARSYFSSLLSLTKFPKGPEREEKVKLMAERLIKIVLYISTSSSLFYILKQGSFLHTYLLGSNPSPTFYLLKYPCEDLPKNLDEFYVMKIALTLFDLSKTLIFDTKRRDFPEFFFHHLLTLSLVLQSYSVNMMAAGAITLLLHDLGDIVVSVFKLCADTTTP